MERDEVFEHAPDVYVSSERRKQKLNAPELQPTSSVVTDSDDSDVLNYYIRKYHLIFNSHLAFFCVSAFNKHYWYFFS